MAKREIKIPKDVERFGTWDLKKFKKKGPGYEYDSKKELKEAFELYMLELLPEVIEFLVKYGHINRDEVREIKESCYARLIDTDFVKRIRKELKKDNDIKNIELLPILFREILFEAQKANASALAKDPNADLIDLSDVEELITEFIVKKKMKKLKKAGIPEAFAFDILTIIPCKEALGYGQFYRIHCLYDCMYEHAKKGNMSTIKFAQVMEALVDVKLVPEDMISYFILFALLERKEKFSKITDEQKPLYTAITTWCFDEMERHLKKSQVEEIISLYVSSRKKDDAQGKDSNRRYVLSTLSEQEYARISKIVKNFIVKDESVKKYL